MSDANSPSSVLSEPRASQTEISFSAMSNGPSPPKTDAVSADTHQRYFFTHNEELIPQSP
jgi:hypothetical protein